MVIFHSYVNLYQRVCGFIPNKQHVDPDAECKFSVWDPFSSDPGGSCVLSNPNQNPITGPVYKSSHLIRIIDWDRNHHVIPVKHHLDRTLLRRVWLDDIPILFGFWISHHSICINPMKGLVGPCLLNVTWQTSQGREASRIPTR